VWNERKCASYAPASRPEPTTSSDAIAAPCDVMPCFVDTVVAGYSLVVHALFTLLVVDVAVEAVGTRLAVVAPLADGHLVQVHLVQVLQRRGSKRVMSWQRSEAQQDEKATAIALVLEETAQRRCRVCDVPDQQRIHIAQQRLRCSIVV
jgi:hypothetical protein